MLLLSRLFVGLLLLFLGRRLYWLFVAGIGFVCGLELAPRILPQQSETVIVLAALGLALVGALVAVVAAKVVLGLIGFAAGCGTAALLLPDLGGDWSGLLALGIYLVAGVVGAVLLVLLFDWALIAISSLAGAGLVTASAEQMVQMPPGASTVLLIALAALGVLVQARLWLGHRSPR